jgi:hypothetical protein
MKDYKHNDEMTVMFGVAGDRVVQVAVQAAGAVFGCGGAITASFTGSQHAFLHFVCLFAWVGLAWNAVSIGSGSFWAWAGRCHFRTPATW